MTGEDDITSFDSRRYTNIYHPFAGFLLSESMHREIISWTNFDQWLIFFQYFSYSVHFTVSAPTKRPTTEGPIYKMSQPKASQLQNVPSPKRKVPTPKRPKPHPRPQNVPILKRPKPQNIPTIKRFKPQKTPQPTRGKLVYFINEDGPHHDVGMC